MAAEKGNYTVSDPCMTVGFGFGLKVGGRMTESSRGDVALVHERMSERPSHGWRPNCQSGEVSGNAVQHQSQWQRFAPVPPLNSLSVC